MMSKFMQYSICFDHKLNGKSLCAMGFWILRVHAELLSLLVYILLVPGNHKFSTEYKQLESILINSGVFLAKVYQE